MTDPSPARRPLGWTIALGTLAALLVVLALTGPDWPVTGMPARLTLAFGWQAVATGLGALAYMGRKRLALALWGRLDRWLWAHVQLSLIFLLALALHMSLGARDGLPSVRWGLPAAAAAAVLALLATGALGSYLYAWLPPRLARRQARPLREVDLVGDHIERVLAGKSTAFRRALDPKLRLVAGGAPEADHWRGLRAAPPELAPDEAADFRLAVDLLALRAELWNRASGQLEFAPLVRGFVITHVALTAVTVLLVALHIVDVYQPIRWRAPRAADYPTAAECAACHPATVAAWRTSPHARAATSPLTRAMNLAVDDTLRPAGAADGHGAGVNATCMGCHAPLGAELGLFAGAADAPLPPAAAEGITCVVCHAAPHVGGDRVVKVGTLDAPFPVRWSDEAVGPFGSGGTDDPRPVRNAFHRSVAAPALSGSETCRACHNVIVDRASATDDTADPAPVVRLQETFDEWAASPYAAGGTSCQDCHMPPLGPAASASEPWGVTFERALPTRPRSDHAFAGVDTAFWDEPAAGEDVRIAALLEPAADLELDAPASLAPGEEAELVVRVRNAGAGHDLPTGFVFEREVWLEVTVTDATGRVLFASGHRDAFGRLFDELNPGVWSEPGLYDAHLVNLRGRMVRVTSGRAAWTGPDRTVTVPPDTLEGRRNLNGTPVLGATGIDVTPILARLGPPRSPGRGAALEEVFLQSQADAVIKNGIPAHETRRARYPLAVPQTAGGPLTVSVRLLLRPMPPHVVGEVLGLPDLVTRLPVFELGAARATVDVAR